MLPEPLEKNEIPQLKPVVPEEVTQPETSPAQDKRPAKKSNVVAIILGFLVFILLVGAAGLGYLAYTLNTQLTSTQQQLTTLQEEHTSLQTDYAKLTSDNEKLAADLNQTNSDLDKTKADLATVQSDLKKSQDQNKALNAKLDSAQKKAEILYAAANVKSPKDFLATDTLVKSANDKQILAEWDKFTSAPSGDAAANFLIYMISSVRDALK